MTDVPRKQNVPNNVASNKNPKYHRRADAHEDFNAPNGDNLVKAETSVGLLIAAMAALEGLSWFCWGFSGFFDSHGSRVLSDVCFYLFDILNLAVMMIAVGKAIGRPRIILIAYLLLCAVVGLIIYSYAGGPMPRISVRIAKYIIAAAMTTIACLSWFWAVRGPKAKPVLSQSLQTQQESRQPTTQTSANPTTAFASAKVDDERLLGFSLIFYIRIEKSNANHRQFIFDLGKVSGERLSIYISPDNNFTVSFVDAKREPHLLQIPMGGTMGFPLGRAVSLICELGISGTSTELRAFVDARSIGSIRLPFKTDIGELDLPNGVLGADLTGKNGAAFALNDLTVLGNTTTDKERKELSDAASTEHWKKPAQFDGNSWMRITGEDDLSQPDASKAPILNGKGVIRFKNALREDSPATSAPSSQPATSPTTQAAKPALPPELVSQFKQLRQSFESLAIRSANGLYHILSERQFGRNAPESEDGDIPRNLIDRDSIIFCGVLPSEPLRPRELTDDEKAAAPSPAEDDGYIRDLRGRPLAKWEPGIQRSSYVYGDHEIWQSFRNLADAAGSSMQAIPDDVLRNLPEGIRSLCKFRGTRHVEYVFGKVPSLPDFSLTRGWQAGGLAYADGVVVHNLESADASDPSGIWMLLLHRLGWNAPAGSALRATRWHWHDNVSAEFAFGGNLPMGPKLPTHRLYSILGANKSSPTNLCWASVWAIDRLLNLLN